VLPGRWSTARNLFVLETFDDGEKKNIDFPPVPSRNDANVYRNHRVICAGDAADQRLVSVEPLLLDGSDDGGRSEATRRPSEPSLRGGGLQPALCGVIAGPLVAA
jgi:hypothetical protein